MKAVSDISSLSSQRQRNNKYIISKWTKLDTFDLYTLEEKTWAPWLRKPQKNFANITKLFSEGQRKITDIHGNVVAMISTNRINWDGKTESLTSWDITAGGSIKQSDFSNSFVVDGNTLDIMSISVDPDMRGKGLATILVREVMDIAQYLGVEHLIVSLRPCDYGSFKLQSDIPVAFDEYCKLTTTDGLPWDPWLRVAARYRMDALRIEKSAITVQVSSATFEEYKQTYNKNNWRQNTDSTWECGEAGMWTVGKEKAIYVEPNLWGEIPLR